MSSRPNTTQDDNVLIVKTAEGVFVELLGEHDGKKVLPQFLKNRTLTVSCLSSTAAEAIRTRQQEIVDKINGKLVKKKLIELGICSNFPLLQERDMVSR